ncbi:RNA-directed DNA polymerase, eukaryota, reverse transcriptase zinc-binding domain protein [Tanacetum coccineum]
MNHWIMTCVSSCAYSICVNRSRYGYFKGGKGLRQGDLISPYLFTLVMEGFSLIMQKNVDESQSFKYHQGCKDMKLTYLCFTDDLLVLCHGDSGFVEVVKKSLDEYSQVSGLHPNMIKRKVQDWKNKMLSYARRLQLITYVLDSMQVYDSCKGKAKTAWKLICRPKDQGGSLGWKNLIKIRDTVKSKIIHVLGNGMNTSMWYDKWHPQGPLCALICRRARYEAGLSESINVSDMVEDGDNEQKYDGDKMNKDGTNDDGGDE